MGAHEVMEIPPLFPLYSQHSLGKESLCASDSSTEEHVLSKTCHLLSMGTNVPSDQHSASKKHPLAVALALGGML